MKRFLREGLFLALGLACAPASGQELNFRAVPPRPSALSTSAATASAATASASSTSEIPFTLSRPTAADAAITPVFRAKPYEEGGLVVPTDAARIENVRFVQNDAPQRLSPMPIGTSTDFAPPRPQLIAPPSGGGFVGSSPAPYFSGPTGSGPIVPGPIMPGPIMPGQIGSGPLGGGPIVSGPYGAEIVDSGPVSTSGCACNGGGYSVMGGFIGDDCMDGVCGLSCGDCDWHWRPLKRIHDFFACINGCCGPRTPFWVRGEYLAWDLTRQNTPPLATQFAGGPGNYAGLPIGMGTVIYDGSSMSNAVHNGFRVSMGFWFPRHNDWGMDASYFVLGARGSSFSASSTGADLALGRPIIVNSPGENFGQNSAEIVAGNLTDLGLPITPGTLVIENRTRLWGVDANLRRKLCCGPKYWLDGLIGFRHTQLEDTLNFSEDIGPVSNASRTLVSDSFGTNNVFNGGQLGLEAEWRFCPRLTLGGSFKIAAGNMHQTININGSTTIENGNFNGNTFARQTQSGGLLAQGTNIGSHSADRFAVVPEIGLKFGWDITQHWRFYAGYNVLYISNVVRAGEQLDLRVNRTQSAFAGVDANGVANGSHGVLAPGSPATPAVLFRTTEFWAQGVSLGLEYRY